MSVYSILELIPRAQRIAIIKQSYRFWGDNDKPEYKGYSDDMNKDEWKNTTCKGIFSSSSEDLIYILIDG